MVLLSGEKPMKELAIFAECMNMTTEQSCCSK